MKNTIIFIIIALSAWYFVSEGEKKTGSENLTIAEKLKLGVKSTLISFLNVAENSTASLNESWEPSFVGENPPDYMMENLNNPAFSNFQQILKPKRGSFIKREFSQSSN